MDRKKIVAGNWKMNTTYNESIDLVKSISGMTKGVSGVEKIVFPPFPFLKTVSDLLHSENEFHTGAQNVSEHARGAYTGEISAAMLKSVGCEYVLVGHSERREYFDENGVQLLQKIKLALANGLKIIFCFGESLGDRKNATHFETVKQQLHEVLEHFPEDQISSLVLAYEPVWAIGTGETASPKQAQEMHAFIRKTIADLFSNQIASGISILYGGSCNPQNAKELFACPDVDGGLIGGASLKAEDFCKIINSFS